jgi:hypothetical protein
VTFLAMLQIYICLKTHSVLKSDAPEELQLKLNCSMT